MNVQDVYDDSYIKKKTAEQHKRTLAALKKSGDSEKSGRLLYEAIIYKPTKTLEKQALSWIKRYPLNDYSPPLTALLLNRYSQLSDLTKELIQYYPLDSSLAYLIKTLLERARPRRKFFKHIEARMDSEPDNYAWVMALGSKRTSKEEEALTLKLIELNMDSEDNLIPLLALSARYPSVIEHSLNWFNQQDELDENISMGLYGLQSQAAKRHPELLPKINRYARKLVRANDGAQNKDEYLAVIHSTLIRTGGSKADIERAREWYGRSTNRKKHYSWDILLAILQCRDPRSKDGAWAIAEAKSYLRGQTELSQVPVLVGELLNTCPDAESLGFAKACNASFHFPWLEKLIEEKEEAALKT